ncbi:MAG: phenazine biosynthesis protein [Oscillospiraceae bacterium]|nr:phenazine biosynthesis protein [Oscillospiraceae bacterium]
MKRTIALLLVCALALCLAPMALASGEASGEAALTEEEQLWWDSFEIPEGMEDVTLYPDDQIELREKNYETACRYMQGLSPYLYLLYADDVVTGVAYDFSLTKDSVRTSDIEFQKMLDASNAELYPNWTWTNMEVYQSDDPNIFLVECDGSGTYTVDGEAVRTHTDHYLHKFTLEDGKIVEYIEFNNPIQELLEMGIDAPNSTGGDMGDLASGEASGETSAEASAEIEETETAQASQEETAMTEEELAWWEGFEIPDGMETVVLFPDEEIELRTLNYETVCRFMQGLSPYLYLLYADEFTTGVAYDFGGTTNPFNPVMCSDLSMQMALDASNAESYEGWVYENFVVYQSDDPNVFLVECDGSCDAHADHYVHKFVLTEGKISQYVEFNSPLNELIESGYEVPDIS